MLAEERRVASSCREADDGYDLFQKMVAEAAMRDGGPMFATDVGPDDLWSTYLDNLPAENRKHYDCRCCRAFIKKYGGLVTISGGESGPLIWDDRTDYPDFFRGSVARLCDIVARARVTGVFLSSLPIWGTPQTGQWSHLHAPSPRVYVPGVLDASQKMAEKREEHGMLQRALADYPREAAKQALRVLEADAVERSEKALGVARWFLALHEAVKDARGSRRDSHIWETVAYAPLGFCHVRSTMISTLLDDIVAGLPFDAIAGRWKKKMHPLQYMRPTAPPSSGTIDAAERLVERLGLARSFARRYATLDDVLSKLWVSTPPAETPKAAGVFGALRTPTRSSITPVELPPRNITWERFRRDVLPNALSMSVRVPASGPFFGLATATDSESPPLHQWDGLEGHARNPVSWYYYQTGSTASRWGLSVGSAVPVTAVFLPPHQWQEPGKFIHHSRQAFFSLEGCQDANGENAGLALFPETMRSELHGIRSVIEAHSSKGSISGKESGTANGISFQDGSTFVLPVRVTTAAGAEEYRIDRWE